MGFNSIWHWVLVLVIVLIVFGTKKLSNVGKDLGGAIKGFKEAMKESEDMPKVVAKKETEEGQTIEAEVAEKK